MPRAPIFALLWLLPLCACTRPNRYAAATGPTAPLLREFADSYPEEVKATGTVREFAIEAAPVEINFADGRPLKVWAYNGTVPGPTLRVKVGETLRVRFTNKLPQETTIHWHGVRVPNAMDGTPHISQHPVAPGGTFVYEFVPKDAGTFWFHPHVRGSEQVERGLYGVLVVEDTKPPPFSREVVWVLDDWLLTPEHEIAPEFNTRHDLAHDGRWGNVVTVNGRVGERLDVRPGERIRLRLINTSNGRVYTPDLAGLDAQVIAMDGLYAAKPLPADKLEIAPGNRVDLDVRVPPSARGTTFSIVDRYTRRPNALAQVRVLDEPPVATPDFPSPAKAHVPKWKEAASLPVRVEYKLNARQGGPFGIEWTLNDRAFAGHDHAAMLHHPVETFAPHEWIKLRFTNESFRIHPMHMHGLFFKVLARNGQPVDEQHFRDTVLVHPKETVDVGLVPLDEGKWMMHCHILEHAEAGMMTLFEVKRAGG